MSSATLEAAPVELSAAQVRQAALEWGLTEWEYEQIRSRLGREPTLTEAAMFSVEWCEHCGYPKSKNVLKTLPGSSRRFEVLVGADSGGFYLTPELAVVMKVESHNHPSQVEPYQGAATGVGGIVRDIFTCGARPIANGNSLRFGPLDDPYTRYLLRGVVHGIADYGNSIGVPTVAGELVFDEKYRGNCLVNALSVGLAPVKMLVSSAAAGVGNPVIYAGARTGRDGIGGCSVLASHEFGHGDEKRPTVQIGDPFTEKRLIEACLEAAASDALVAMKDMGAAGVTCTTSEMAAAGGMGMRVDLQAIPRREEGMAPWEVLMSESQERMLLVGERGREDELLSIFHRWGLQAVVIGEVTGDGMLTVFDGARQVASVPAEELTSAPRYDLPSAEPAYLREAWATDLSTLPEPRDYGAALLDLLGSPNLCSREWVWEQYDHTVQSNTITGPGQDAAVLRVKEAAPLGLALTLDGSSRPVYLDPYQGARLLIAEASRNLACVGAEPRIVTDGLNFGNPDKPDRFFQFKEAVRGIAEACREMDLAVVSGNVSFYNENPSGAILPTPIIGMLGVTPDTSRLASGGFEHEGEAVWMLGRLDPPSLAAGEYLQQAHGLLAGRPAAVDLEQEMRLQQAVRELIHMQAITTAHDLSEGGLAVALAECCIHGATGAVCSLPQGYTGAAGLFGEAPTRVLVSVKPGCEEEADRVLQSCSVDRCRLGHTGGNRLAIEALLDVPLTDLRRRWSRALPSAMGE